MTQAPYEFNSLGFPCTSKHLVIVNETEDMALCEINTKNMNQVLLTCSAEDDCGSKQAFMAIFSHPCMQIFLALAFAELVVTKRNHGIKVPCAFLRVDEYDLFKLFLNNFRHLKWNTNMPPGSLNIAGGAHGYYKCNIVGGSSGGPKVPLS